VIAQHPGPLAPRRILLVEDEPSLVLTLTDRLVSEGYQVETAGDGEEGLSRALEGSFDLILNTVSGAFRIGVQITAPFLIFGLVFNAGLAVLSRMMPQMQVFFIAMPATIMLGLILFALVLAGMMTTWLNYLELGLKAFVSR